MIFDKNYIQLSLPVSHLLEKEPTPILDFLVNRNQYNHPALYVFWWIGNRIILENSNRKIVLKGPKLGKYASHKSVNVEWILPKEDGTPIALYVGKTTNLTKRVNLHLRMGSENHKIVDDNKIKAHTTSCQLRYGLDHLFRQREVPIKEILTHIGVSYEKTDETDGAVMDRFYNENFLIGLLRPWFNVDTER